MASIFILLIFAFLFYLIYLLIYSAFEEVGFKRWEASLIVFSCIIFGYNIFDIPLFSYGNWIIAINIGGALLPILISMYLIFSRKVALRSFLGMIIVAYFAYNVTYVTRKGIVSDFPYWLIPPVVASIYSVLTGLKSKKKSASVAYSSGTIGVLIGADLFHLKELLKIEVGKTTVASIGGASILDMVFLTGVIAVLIDAILYGKEEK
ncbi:MAG TPA: DUF1614 domain-containing protein [Thermoplasmatales archaeon]|nr:DUF1614 domain-containing protein [Thermoplasmatales archaeon]